MTSSKQCGQCKAQKSAADFHKDKTKPDGLHRNCRVCRNARQTAYRKANPEKAKASVAACWEKSRDKYLAKVKAYNATHKEQIYAYQAEYRKANRAKRNAATRAWQKANLDRCREANAQRAASKLMRTPGWAERELIASVYQWRRWLQDVAGVECHVDHIVPLQGDSPLNPGVKACGLHCAANLRVIPGSENSGKRNQVNGDEYLILAEIEQEGFKAWLLEQEGLRA